jgi:pyruvate/2-oxoglutarate dehydrogenase complex dihydrolipoamide dehydrogenase (E3) component
VRIGPGGVEVDDRLRTSARGVWACGDVIGGLRFTHVADYEARLVLRNALFPLSARRDYRVVPWVTFTDPALAHVGLTEAEARERHGSGVQVFRRPWNDLDRALADGHDVGLLKLVTDRRGHILGGHVLGEGAAGVIHEIALAMRHGLTAAQVGSLVHAYPTYSEAARQAAEQWTKARFTGPVKGAVRWLVRR